MHLPAYLLRKRNSRVPCHGSPLWCAFLTIVCPVGRTADKTVTKYLRDKTRRGGGIHDAVLASTHPVVKQ